MAVAFVDHSASVLVVAASRDLATPVLDYFFDQGMAFGFSRPADLAYTSGRLDAIYRMAIVLDLDVGERLHTAAHALSRDLPCVLVSDRAIPQRHEFRDVLHTDTSPAQLFDAVRSALAGRATTEGLVGQAPVMRQVDRLIGRVANKSTPVLLLGESGSGKELAAREIHRRSGRAGAFVSVNCAAIGEADMGSTLFGASRSAGDTSAGCFVRAQGGTLLLDEIGDMSLSLQARLQRRLDEAGAMRDEAGRGFDVRLIASSRHNLVDAIEAGTFRADLFFRLAVFPIRMPPLRERTADMSALVEALGAGLPGGRPRFDATAIARLKSYGWPGNVLELANVIERFAILYPDETVDRRTLEAHLHPLDAALVGSSTASADAPVAATQVANMTLPEEGVDLRELVERLEKRLIEQALDRTEGIVAHAARHLGLRRTTLTEKLRRYGMSAD